MSACLLSGTVICSGCTTHRSVSWRACRGRRWRRGLLSPRRCCVYREGSVTRCDLRVCCRAAIPTAPVFSLKQGSLQSPRSPCTLGNGGASPSARAKSCGRFNPTKKFEMCEGSGRTRAFPASIRGTVSYGQRSDAVVICPTVAPVTRDGAMGEAAGIVTESVSEEAAGPAEFYIIPVEKPYRTRGLGRGRFASEAG
jgi:hypothetical protein